METGHLPAFLLIAGFMIMLLGFLIGLGSIYQTTDLNEREWIINENQTRWYAGQMFSGLGIFVITIGFVVLAAKLQTMGTAWIPILGAATLVIGIFLI
jgi:hypothetical protein